MEIGNKVIAKVNFLDCNRNTLKGIIIGFDWCGWPIVKFNRKYMYALDEVSDEWIMSKNDLQLVSE